MTPETENFDGLRRLLKLKRYEQPPPGYFNDFSRGIIVRLKSGGGEARQHPFERLLWEVRWVQRLIEAFQAKPALAVTFGAAVCALLVGGIVYLEGVEFKPAPLMPGVENFATGTPAPTTPEASATFGWNSPGSGTLAISGTNSSIDSMQPAGSLFDIGINRIKAEPASWPFRSPGN